MAGGRQHIVKPIPDHKETYQAAVEEWKEENVKETESTSHYKNLGAKRPVCQKLYDHLTLGVSVISLDFCVTISLHFITRHDSPDRSLSSATLLTHKLTTVAVMLINSKKSDQHLLSRSLSLPLTFRWQNATNCFCN